MAANARRLHAKSTEGAPNGRQRRRGQFAVLLHALCWIHAERLVHKLIPVSDEQKKAVEEARSKRSEIWSLYSALKTYKRNPSADMVEPLEKRFDSVFTRKTGYETLEKLLERLNQHKDGLLLV